MTPDVNVMVAASRSDHPHPKIFQQPTSIEDAVAFVDALLTAPGVQLATLGAEWPKFQQLCLDKQLRGQPDPGLTPITRRPGPGFQTLSRASPRAAAAPSPAQGLRQ